MTRIHRLSLISVVFILVGFPFRFAFAGDAATSTPKEPPTPARAVSLTVRDGAALIWRGGVSVPDSDTATTTLSATDGTQADVLAASALAALIAADTAAPEFSISSLQYFSSFGSFYVRCITHALEQCDNWQYTAGAAYPSAGMDKFLMRDGDTLFVYFGSPRRTTLGASTVSADEPFTARAEKYVPSSGAYAPAEGVTVGVTQANPDDPFTPRVIATSTTDAAGAASFTLSGTGTYAVGIAEDYYYPSVPLTVVGAPAEKMAAPDADSGEPPRRGSMEIKSAVPRGGADIPAALSFLAAHQNTDGSFSTPLLSDWAALAFSATPEEERGETLLRRYLIDAPPRFSSVTDYERRAMALMAQNVNPYSGTATDYIAKILSYFDGAQFGDASLINDDIFALLTLFRAGYGAEDAPISNALAFILSRQRSDGSWEGNVDMTAAAIQALAPVETQSGVSSALSRAREYLRAKQEASGGFGNSFSTSWALQAINLNGGGPSLWQSGGKNPLEYLASLQFGDGGWEPPSSDMLTRVWATAYSIPAALGKSWPFLLASFEKPADRSTDDAPSVSASASASVASVPTESAMRAPMLAEAPTTLQSESMESASSSPTMARTPPEFALPMPSVLDASTTAPRESAPHAAALSGREIPASETPQKPKAPQPQESREVPKTRDVPALANDAKNFPANAASVAVAAEAAGLSKIFTQAMSWFGSIGSQLLALFF